MVERSSCLFQIFRLKSGLDLGIGLESDHRKL